jgi:hypothetical protein
LRQIVRHVLCNVAVAIQRQNAATVLAGHAAVDMRRHSMGSGDDEGESEDEEDVKSSQDEQKEEQEDEEAQEQHDELSDEGEEEGVGSKPHKV